MKNYIKQIKDELFELRRWAKLVVTYPKLSLKKVDYDAYWKDKRGAEIGRLSDWQIERAEIISTQIKKDNLSQIEILDVGCGDGSILSYLSKTINLRKMYGADSSSFALRQAESSGVVGSLIDIADTTQLNHLPETDYVLLLEILEHIPNPEAVLSCVYEKAKQAVFFSFPNSGFIVYRLRLLFGKMPMQWRLHPSEHIRFWTYRDLRWWLDSLGYTQSTVHFYKGIPGLRTAWPSLFAAGFVVHVRRG